MTLLIFSLNETLRAAEKIYDEKESLSMLWEYQDSMKSLQKLIDQWCKEMTVIVKTILVALCQSIMSVESVIENLSIQFKNLTLLLQIKLNNIKQMLERVIIITSQLCVSQSYQHSLQQALSQNYSSQNYLSVNYTWSAQQSNSQQNNQLTWSQISQQKSDQNVCWFCHEWDHHCQICSHLLHLIEDKKVHLDERLCIVWRSEKSDELLMSLDSFMHQLNSVLMLLKKKKQHNRSNTEQHHNVNLLDLQCNSDSDLKEDNLLNIFEYQISSVKNSEVYALTQNNQKKYGCECSLHSVLNWKTRIMKEQIQKECRLFALKILCLDEWQDSQIVISEFFDRMRQDVYEDQNVKKNMSDDIMNVDELRSRTVQFANTISKDKEKQRAEINNESVMLKIKNVKLADVLHEMTEQNSVQVIQKMLHSVVSDITVENILISELIAYKLMFKSEKFNVIKNISELNRVNVNNIKIHQLSNVLYSSVSPQAIVKVRNEQVSVLLDSEVKVNLMLKSVLQKLNMSYTVNIRLRLVNINDDEIMLHDICKNVKVQISSVSVMQFLLIVKSASQFMMLRTLYASVILMIT